MNPYICCIGEKGAAVVFGWSLTEPKPGEIVVLHEARMILYWSEECGGLFGLAANGAKPGCRITAPTKTISTDLRNVLAVSELAAKTISEYQVYAGGN